MRFTSIDKRMRRELGAEETLLLEAYEAATKRVVHLDYERAGVLVILANRGVTQDDIFTVVSYVKRLIRKGENRQKIGTFVPASLEFVNLLGDTSKFCDRLQTARECLISKAHRGKGLAPVTLKIAEGETITRIQEVERAPAECRELVVASLKSLILELQKP